MAKLDSGLPPDPEARLKDMQRINHRDFCTMSARSVMIVLGLAIIFLGLFARRPLWHTDLWDHINYGRFILQFGVPETEPLLEMTKGTPFVSTAWLSQIGMATIADSPTLGLPGLQFVHGLLATIGCACVGLCVFERSRSSTFAVIGYCVFVAVNWQQLIVIRPQLVGVACFCMTFAALQTGFAKSTAGKVWLGLMFMLWANCHGSFAMGLMLIGLTTAGQLLDAAIKTRDVFAAFKIRQWKAMLLVLLVCAIVVTLNPFGVRIYGEVLRVGRHPNIATMFEWDPMTLQMKQGKAMAVATIVLIALMANSPRRKRMNEILPLLVTGGLAVWSARMVNWYAPLVASSIGMHGAAVFRRVFNRPIIEHPCRRRYWGVVNLGLLVTVLVCSSLGTETLFGKTAGSNRFLSAQTPVDVTQFLATVDDLPEGLTLAPAEWSGFIMYHAGDRVRPFVNLHVHVIPPNVWKEYIRMILGLDGWGARLDLYGVNTVVVDKLRYPQLIALVTSNRTFDCVFDDEQAAVYVRRAER